MINDMGIKVVETAPDADDLALSDDTTITDEDAAEAAAAALSSVESEIGRTTDPVRMYMREMGTVELLTREGEIDIAKRIEDGINQVQSAIAEYPGTIPYILEQFDRVQAEELRLTDLISGFVDPNDMETEAPTATHIGSELLKRISRMKMMLSSKMKTKMKTKMATVKAATAKKKSVSTLNWLVRNSMNCAVSSKTCN